jgi:hypothetical protein
MNNFDLKKYLAEGRLYENTDEEIKVILTKSYPGAYSEEDFEEIINLYNTKYKDYKDEYGELDGVEQSAFKFNYANNRDIITGMKAGSKSSTSVDFPEMEDEFEGAMSSMSVSKEEYLQDIINASDDEIVSDGYFEIKNAVEQGVYSKDEAVKLAKSWAKEKLSTLAEGKQLKEETDDSVKTDTPIKKSKMKKETVDSKLAEIEKQSQVVALEAKIAAIDEMIETKNQRISMISEDENLSELVDKAKMKVMQREVKDLERRKVKIEKLYEKMCGKSYTKEKIVDEEMSTELNENKTKMKKSELKEMIKDAMMSEVQNKVSEQTDQFKKGDKVKYDGEKHLVVNILKDGSPVLVPMSVIDDEAFSIDSDEIEESKTMDEIQYDIDDTNSDYDFLAEEYEATDHDIQIGPAMAGIVNIRKYLEKSAPEYLSDLKAIDSVLTSYDNKMAYGDDDLGVPGDNALGLEENRSEFDTNKPGRVGEFIKALDDLVDEYHAELYLNDELFAAMNDVKSAAKLEMGREDEMDDMPGFEGTKDSLRSLGLEEAEEEVEDEEVDVTDGEEEVETTDVETTTEVDPNVKAVQDALTAAQAAAADLGDEKLTDQIGNTITFFTRQHVANIDSMNEMDVQDAADDTETKIDSVAAAMIGLNESRNRMLKLAGIIK